MAVVGIDYGNLDCVVAQAKRGGIDIVLNENANRKNPNLVCMQGKQRLMGEAASSVARMHFKNTAVCIKRMIGKKFKDPDAQSEIKDLPFKCVELEDGNVGVVLNYNDGEVTFTCEQLAAMMFKKMALIASAANEGVAVSYVVISAPGYFTDIERRALLNASKIAGLNCLRLINEHTAVALAYGIYKSARNLFHESEPQYVMFIDMGNTSYTVSIVAFVQGQLKVKSVAFDRHLGGRNFDTAIAEHAAADFKEKHKRDPMEIPKSKMKLLSACEKAKKNLSPQGVNATSIRVECLVEELDMSMTLSLEKYEELIEPFLSRLEAPIQKCLADAGVDKSQLTHVEIVGGATRVASVKRKLSEILGLDQEKNNFGLSTTLNADESVARGCALQCAILSPVFKVKEFQIADTISYPVRVSWDPENALSAMDTTEDGEEESLASDSTSSVIFPKNEDFPKTKRITFRRPGTFDIRAEYDEGASLPEGADKALGTYTISGIPPQAEGEDLPRIRVHVKEDINGMFSVSSSQLMQEIKEEPKAEEPEASKESEKKEAKEGEKESESAEPAPKKKRFRKIELKVESSPFGMSAAALTSALEEELKMAQQDRIIEETAIKRNELESYIYDMRNKLCDNLKDFVNASDKEAFENALNNMEDWLYSDEGFDSVKSVYIEKLSELQKFGSPIELRVSENSSRPAATSEFLALTEDYKKLANSQDEKYAHWTDAERDSIRKHVSEAETWINEQLDAQTKLNLFDTPVLLTADIRLRMNNLRDECRPVLTKPIPKPEPKETPPAPEEPKKEESEKTEEPKKEGADMDLD